MNINDLSKQYHAALMAHDKQAQKLLVDHYGAAYQRIKFTLDALLKRVGEAKARGEYSPSWPFQENRLNALLAQIRAEIDQFSTAANGVITEAQRVAVELAIAHAEQSISAARQVGPAANSIGVSVGFSRLPALALHSLIGTLGNGSPLKSLLDELGPSASAAVKTALVAGLAQGKNAKSIAVDVRDALGGNLTRALKISRTETLRSYRAATLETYKANSDVVKKWRRKCSLSVRTCALCLALDGTEYDLDTDFQSHVCCRCVLIPITEFTPEPAQSGADWFAKQSPDRQAKILGPAKALAYRAGDITLHDLVRHTDSPDWGKQVQEKSLADIIGDKGAAKYISAAMR